MSLSVNAEETHARRGVPYDPADLARNGTPIPVGGENGFSVHDDPDPRPCTLGRERLEVVQEDVGRRERTPIQVAQPVPHVGDRRDVHGWHMTHVLSERERLVRLHAVRETRKYRRCLGRFRTSALFCDLLCTQARITFGRFGCLLLCTILCTLLRQDGFLFFARSPRALLLDDARICCVAFTCSFRCIRLLLLLSLASLLLDERKGVGGWRLWRRIYGSEPRNGPKPGRIARCGC